MKLDARRVEAFLTNPGSCRVVLLHGDDIGAIRERANRLVLAVAGSIDDPFRVTELERDGFPRIPEEVASRSLAGGRRVVRVRDATEAAAGPVAAALARPGDALLVIEAPTLAARSKLRTMLDKMADAATIGCYPVAGPALEEAIGETLRQFGVTIDRDARAWLATRLGADQAITGSELVKLSLYVGKDGHVDLDAAMACVGDLAGLSLDDAVFAAMAGNVEAADRALELAMDEGATAVGALRAMLGHVQRLQLVSLRMNSGVAASDAIKDLRPPVFFRREASFLQALRLWSSDELHSACDRIWEAERSSKRTGFPAATLARSILLGMAQRAAVARRRRTA